MTTLVNVDAEAAIKLCHFISSNMTANGPAFFEECSRLFADSQTKELINKILSQKTLILGCEKEKDAEGCFEVLFSLIYTLPDHNERQNIIKTIIAALTSEPIHKPNLCLKALVALFNLSFSGESKFDVLLSIFMFARQTKQSNEITHFHVNFDSWVKSWNLSVPQQLELLKNISIVLQEAGQSALSMNTMTKFFQTLKSSQTPINFTADLQEIVITTILSGIRSPISAFSGRMALLEAVQVFKFGEPLTTLVEVLRIINDGALRDYQAFAPKAADVFEKFSIDSAVIEHRLRLLALCSLASNAVDKTLSFKAIADVLGCSIDGEVEIWVIEAISESLIEATIDQVNQSVSISKYAHRSFGMNDWRSLQAQLRRLRSNVGSCINDIDKSKAPLL